MHFKPCSVCCRPARVWAPCHFFFGKDTSTHDHGRPSSAATMDMATICGSRIGCYTLHFPCAGYMSQLGLLSIWTWMEGALQGLVRSNDPFCFLCAAETHCEDRRSGGLSPSSLSLWEPIGGEGPLSRNLHIKGIAE